MRSLLDSPSNSVLRRLLTDQGFKHWKGYAFAFAMMALIALTTSLSAWIIGKIVNEVFVGRNLAAVWEITAAIVIIYTVKGLATYGQQVVMSQVGNSIVANISARNESRGSCDTMTTTSPTIVSASRENVVIRRLSTLLADWAMKA